MLIVKQSSNIEKKTFNFENQSLKKSNYNVNFSTILQRFRNNIE